MYGQDAPDCGGGCSVEPSRLESEGSVTFEGGPSRGGRGGELEDPGLFSRVCLFSPAREGGDRQEYVLALSLI